jgi:hypothetical protein
MPVRKGQKSGLLSIGKKGEKLGTKMRMGEKWRDRERPRGVDLKGGRKREKERERERGRERQIEAQTG